MSAQGYGQYCPLSMAAEILAQRWTLLILRELLEGSTTFNDISRGVPLMSRTLLARRLRDLEAAGILTRETAGRGRPVHHHLSAAGRALGPIVRAVAEWGQEWIDTEPSLEDVDTDFLMWDIRRNARPLPDLPPRFTAHFSFPDAPEGKREHWLMISGGAVDVCYTDPGHPVQVFVEAAMKDMVRVWMGWLDLSVARSSGVLHVDGPRHLTDSIRDWLGLSSVSGITKRPTEQRVLRVSAQPA